MKKEIPDKWQNVNKKLTYPYEYCIDNFYQKPVKKLKKEDFFSKSKKSPGNEEIERTEEISKLFDIKPGEELTQLFLKNDVILLTDVFEKLIKTSTKE